MRRKFKFRRTKIWKIITSEDLWKFEFSIMPFEITFIVCSCHFFKDSWEVEISSEQLPFYLSPTIVKIVLHLWSFNCFKAASTASLSASIVADGSASNIRTSDFYTWSHELEILIKNHWSTNRYIHNATIINNVIVLWDCIVEKRRHQEYIVAEEGLIEISKNKYPSRITHFTVLYIL